MTHTNRREHTYHLHAEQMKTGKAKWCFSLQPDGTLAGQIPDGFEGYEKPDGLVVLRRCLIMFLPLEELDIVRGGIETCSKLPPHWFMVDHDRDGDLAIRTNG